MERMRRRRRRRREEAVAPSMQTRWRQRRSQLAEVVVVVMPLLKRNLPSSLTLVNPSRTTPNGCGIRIPIIPTMPILCFRWPIR